MCVDVKFSEPRRQLQEDFTERPWGKERREVHVKGDAKDEINLVGEEDEEK